MKFSTSYTYVEVPIFQPITFELFCPFHGTCTTFKGLAVRGELGSSDRVKNIDHPFYSYHMCEKHVKSIFVFNGLFILLWLVCFDVWHQVGWAKVINIYQSTMNMGCRENLDRFQACFFPWNVHSNSLQIGESLDFMVENPRVGYIWIHPLWMNRARFSLRGYFTSLVKKSYDIQTFPWSPYRNPHLGVQLGLLMDISMVSSLL